MSADAGRPEKRAISGSKRAGSALAGSLRTIGAAYTGGARFRQCGGAYRVSYVKSSPACGPAFFETAHSARIIQYWRCITLKRMGPLSPHSGTGVGGIASIAGTGHPAPLLL